MNLVCGQCGSGEPFRFEGKTWVISPHDCPKTTLHRFNDWPEIRIDR